MTLIDRLQGWYQFFDKTEFNTVLNVLRKEYSIHSVMPDSHNIFRAFEYASVNCNVIVIGQDPYPQKGVATGIAFGNEGVDYDKISPSLSKLLEPLTIDSYSSTR